MIKSEFCTPRRPAVLLLAGLVVLGAACGSTPTKAPDSNQVNGTSGSGSGGASAVGGEGGTSSGGGEATSSGGTADASSGAGSGASGGTSPDGDAGPSSGGSVVDGGTPVTVLPGACPAGVAWDTVAADGYPGTMDKATTFIDPSFQVANETRAFVVRLPPNYDKNKVYPVLTIITGTVESTLQSMFETSQQLGQEFLKNDWILLGPIRRCSNGDQASTAQCPNDTTPGFTWWPWAEGAAAGSTQYTDKAGPDAAYMQAMVKCAATRYKFDSSRLFVAGVSSGGTMTNRLLTYQNDFWAGGVPESGEWYVGNNAAEEEQAVRAAPTNLFPGRCCPNPLPTKTSPLFVVSVWEGDMDIWCAAGNSNCAAPGPQVLSDYRPATQAASNFYSSLSDSVHVACSVQHFHQWTQVPGFNAWLADLLYAHPKGSTTAPAGFTLPSPVPTPMSCVVGRYTDHYGPNAI